MTSSPPLIRSIVGGVARDGIETPDIDPSRPDELVATAMFADASLVAEAVATARAAFAAWRAVPAPRRGDLLFAAASLLHARADELATLVAREIGKTLVEARGEVARGVAILRYFAGQTSEPSGHLYSSASATTLLLADVRIPVGVVALLTPWNFPVAIPLWKLAPALAFGNCVVWKPSELTPAVSGVLLDVLSQAGVPHGVVNMVLGDGRVGDAVVRSDAIDGVSFTGSEAAGNAIRRAVRPDVRLQLEMSGKNAILVLRDADVERAAEITARGAFLFAGQKCTATSRAIVDRAVFDHFVERLAARAREWCVGDPLDAGTVVGPVASEARCSAVLGALAAAGQRGGACVARGDAVERPNGGFFVAPSVWTELPSSDPLARDEVFGPVVACFPVDGAAEAASLANDSRYGLVATICTADLAAALRTAEELSVGIVKVNQETTGLEPHVPFGGAKASSFGPREQGKTAAAFYSDVKTLYVDA